ncbi:heme-binding protein [Saliphagus sp. LR7]|uniref:SOUL family heme-binding protein n=1 Tax=Saliphagus sp. LR7 TaxID=2282654 RepID=UPI000DF7995C|nr:heme-binding protein [Saliphagus sp. LR7]
MRSRLATVVAATTGTLLAGWIGWGVYSAKTTERVPYDVLESGDGFELRRYPETVLVETTDDDGTDAFRRLFRYIDGENAASDEVAMTAPVRTGRGEGESVAMTAPVRTADRGDGPVTMAFYLPPSYSKTSAPVPTDPDVRLVVEPPRTVAVRRFSWLATDRRVEARRRALVAAVAERGLEVRGEPALLQYNDPWTPPFMRRNEVAVTVG